VAKKSEKVVIATVSLATSIGGHRKSINEGQMYPVSDPLVKKFKDCFVSPEEYARLSGVIVEQATAAPGEKRNVQIPE